jgi:hypothetical protein
VRGSLLLLLCVTACSGPADDAATLRFDPCAPLSLVSADQASIDAAVAAWQAAGVTLAPGGDVIPVVFVDGASSSEYGLYDDTTGTIYVNSSVRAADRPVVIAHELGHALGLVHLTTRPSVMNPDNLVTPPLAADAAEVVALWGACR